MFNRTFLVELRINKSTFMINLRFQELNCMLLLLLWSINRRNT